MSQPIVSMTGFAAVSGEVQGGRFALELKSVNHRYLEFQTRMPEDLRSLEHAMRDLVAAKLTRGKVDCRVTFTPVATRDTLAPNDEALAALAASQQAILEKFKASPPRTLSVWEIMHAPGVLGDAALLTDDARERLLSLTRQALEELNATRAREGEKLKAMLIERLDGIDALVKQVTPLIPQLVAAYQEKLTAKLNEAMAAAAADERVKQEVVLFASRIDVAEELNRLSTHVTEVRRVLKAGGSVGKRLDFLMQELNRESNTLGSKSVSTEATKVSVELKVLIEQMREQIQNIE
ncbi:MAG: YicC family protein [Betaproteobacteria bacterium]|nr:YicC family protein [Betaproteobacteria bacterium]